MKVREVMTGNPKCCGPDTNLAETIELMWTSDCGVLPVIEDGKLMGIVTDRDVCIAVALGTAGRRTPTVKDVAIPTVQTCAPDNDVDTAMATMRRAQVRRLPVIEDGRLVGILALNDIILAAAHKYAPVDADGVMNTMRAVSEHRSPKAEAPSVTPSHWPATLVVA